MANWSLLIEIRYGAEMPRTQDGEITEGWETEFPPTDASKTGFNGGEVGVVPIESHGRA